jgi:hypothetical protein
MLRLLPRVAEGLRLHLLVFTLPVAALWAGQPDSGGGALVLAHCLLVMLYGMTLDERIRAGEVAAGQGPRLTLSHDRMAFSDVEQAIRPARYAVLILALFACVIMAIESLLMAFFSACAVGAILVFTGPGTGREARRRFIFAEWAWAIFAILVPMLLVALRGWSQWIEAGREGSNGAVVTMPVAVIAASGLAALVLGAYVLLCLARDRVRDEAAGWRSTATMLGPVGINVWAITWMIAAAALSAAGAGAGWWAWPVAAIIAAGAAASAALLGASRAPGAVICWWLAAAGIGAALIA